MFSTICYAAGSSCSMESTEIFSLIVKMAAVTIDNVRQLQNARRDQFCIACRTGKDVMCGTDVCVIIARIIT